MTPTITRATTVAASLVLLGALTACGGGSTTSSSSTSSVVTTSDGWTPHYVPTRTEPASVAVPGPESPSADTTTPGHTADLSDAITPRTDLTTFFAEPWGLLRRTKNEAVIEMRIGDPACWGVTAKAEKVGGEIRITAGTGLIPGKTDADCPVADNPVRVKVALPEGSGGLPIVDAQKTAGPAETHRAE